MKPPYGQISAIDLKRGEILWQVAHGETPDNIRNNPALKGLTIPRTGRLGHRRHARDQDARHRRREPASARRRPVQRGAMLRAYDKATRRRSRAPCYMPAPQSGSPMTYMMNGRQYIVVAVSGAGYSGELIAYRLP